MRWVFLLKVALFKSVFERPPRALLFKEKFFEKNKEYIFKREKNKIRRSFSLFT
jgi:hypothetical protein